MEDIKNSENNVLKVQYYYFCQAGYWLEHKIGIRKGNYNMQFKNFHHFFLLPVKVIMQDQ